MVLENGPPIGRNLAAFFSSDLICQGFRQYQTHHSLSWAVYVAS